MKKPTKKKLGTQSARCPRCNSPSRVLRTTRVSASVHRERVCARNHRFNTVESPQ